MFYIIINSRKVGDNKKLYYIYNARDNTGRCHSKSFQDHFIEKVQKFFEFYRKGFDGLYYFLDGEHSIYDENK